MLHRVRARCAAAELLALSQWLRLSGRRLGTAVVFHRVDPVAGDPSTQLVPAVSTRVFRRQLALLRRAFRPVPASALAAAVRERRRGQRLPVAITFDDDLACHTRVSAPLLARAGAPATFFLGGWAIDRSDEHWWEVLQRAVDHGAASAVLSAAEAPAAVAAAWTGTADSIHAVAEEMKQLDPDDRDELTRRLRALDGGGWEREEALSADGIRELVAAGFEVGFHTRRHDYLPVLDADRLSTSLTTGRDQLEGIVGQRLGAIAYPHGGANARIAVAARAAGFSAGFTTQGVALSDSFDELLMGRIECSYRSASELAARICSALRHGRGERDG